MCQGGVCIRPGGSQAEKDGGEEFDGVGNVVGGNAVTEGFAFDAVLLVVEAEGYEGGATKDVCRCVHSGVSARADEERYVSQTEWTGATVNVTLAIFAGAQKEEKFNKGEFDDVHGHICGAECALVHVEEKGDWHRMVACGGGSSFS